MAEDKDKWAAWPEATTAEDAAEQMFVHGLLREASKTVTSQQQQEGAMTETTTWKCGEPGCEAKTEKPVTNGWYRVSYTSPALSDIHEATSCSAPITVTTGTATARSGAWINSGRTTRGSTNLTPKTSWQPCGLGRRTPTRTARRARGQATPFTVAGGASFSATV